jgi:hypothetical protein
MVMKHIKSLITFFKTKKLIDLKRFHVKFKKLILVGKKWFAGKIHLSG